MSNTQLLRTCAAALVAAFVLAVAAIHALERFPAADTTLSEYALGTAGWVMRIGFVALGFAAFLLGYILRTGRELGRLFLWLFGIAMIGVAALNADPGERIRTMHGLEHALSATVAFFSLPIGVWLLGRIPPPLKLTATLQVLAAIALLAHSTSFAGAIELIVTACAIAQLAALLALVPARAA